jgi:hypothetical protein
MAALASVMAYYQGTAHAPRELLERYPQAAADGYSLGELRDIAQAHGFTGFVVPGDMPFLRSQSGAAADP